MKHKFTKLSFLIAVLFISLNAFSAGTTTRVISVEETFDCSNANITSSSTTWVTYTAGNYSSRTNTCDNGSYPNLSGSTRTVVFYVSGVEKFTITAEGNSVNTRTLLYKIGSGSNIETAVYGAGCSSQTFSTGTTGVTTISISGNNGSIYLGKVTFSPPATPAITKFVAEGVEATINESAKTITAELPYGTSLTSIEPVVTIGGTATSYGPTGAQDFSNSVTVPVVYTVSDGVNEVDYSVTLTASQTPSSEKDLSNVMIGGKTPIFDAGTNTYSVMLPKASSLTQAVTFTKPLTATADFTSGNTHDFTNPLTLTVTAQDLSTMVYTLTAAVGNKNIAYIINTAVSANDTKIRPELAKTNYIENILIGTVTTSTDFSMYDLVILTESPSSGSTGMKALWGINKPLLALKIFALNANTWDKGTQASPAAPASTTATVYEPNHPIFAGINLTGVFSNEIVSIGEISTGNGLQTSNFSGDYILGGVGTSPAIIEFPINTPAGATATGYKNQNLIEKLLVLGISDNNQDKLTADGLKLVTNAVNYLTGATTWGTNAGTQFKDITVTYTGNGVEEIGYTTAKLKWNAVPGTVKYIVTQVTPSGVKGVMGAKSAIAIDVPGNETNLELSGLTHNTDYSYSVAAQNAAGVNTNAATIDFKTLSTGVSVATLQNVSFDGRTIQNPDRQQLYVFDATGRIIVTSQEDINMSAHAKGVYLVKSENGIMKIALTK